MAMTCEFCGTVNGEGAGAGDHCTSCGEPLTAAAARADERKTEQRVHQKGLRTGILVGAGVLVAIGGIGAGVVVSGRKAALRAEVKGFYTSFLAKDDLHIAPFWKCVARAEKQPRDNLELAKGVDAAMVKSGGAYGKHVGERCMPLVGGAPASLESLSPPAVLAGPYDAYLDAVRTLGRDAKDFAAASTLIEGNGARDALVKKFGSNYHYAGAESAETWAYDKFLRCAVPAFATMTDPHELLGALGETMKDPVPAAKRWRTECYPILEKTEGMTADADYKKQVETFSSDDRDVQAFQDVLKKAAQKEREQAIAPLEQAWVTFGQARDALTAAFGEHLER